MRATGAVRPSSRHGLGGPRPHVRELIEGVSSHRANKPATFVRTISCVFFATPVFLINSPVELFQPYREALQLPAETRSDLLRQSLSMYQQASRAAMLLGDRTGAQRLEDLFLG